MRVVANKTLNNQRYAYLVIKILNKMDINDINGKIQVKQKEISVERDAVKKYKLQQQLQALQLKKQIANFNQKDK